MPFLSDAEFAQYQQWKSGGQQAATAPAQAQAAPAGTNVMAAQQAAQPQPDQQAGMRSLALQQALGSFIAAPAVQPAYQAAAAPQAAQAAQQPAPASPAAYQQMGMMQPWGQPQEQSAMRRPLGGLVRHRPMPVSAGAPPEQAQAQQQAAPDQNGEARRNAMMSAVGSVY